jgi:hypothetical protein
MSISVATASRGPSSHWKKRPPPKTSSPVHAHPGIALVRSGEDAGDGLVVDVRRRPAAVGRLEEQGRRIVGAGAPAGDSIGRWRSWAGRSC